MCFSKKSAKCTFFSSVSVNLTSLEESGVCVGERIVFTCSVIRAGILQWAVESINEITADPIEFAVTDTAGVVAVNLTDIEDVTLLSKEQNSTYQSLGNLTSQITVLVTSTTLGKRVYCSNGTRGSLSSVVIQRGELA